MNSHELETGIERIRSLGEMSPCDCEHCVFYPPDQATQTFAIEVLHQYSVRPSIYGTENGEIRFELNDVGGYRHVTVDAYSSSRVDKS